MRQLQLKNHPIWQGLTEVLKNLDANYLLTEHLELCNYKICGYWDEQDEYYEEITLPRSLSGELISNSIGVTGPKRWIKFKFSLKHNSQNLGELTLIHDENMELIDENWQINIKTLNPKPPEGVSFVV
ncbi:hypothetical protein NG798_13155 [Ancylothrix sp. C2]|uniref:hypothetical protein n=1 Tax=Ancylothrix sp. D3o TaxID=2953691 RepID=UPI0021BB0BEF|nr:hypothetical protein [Ancylothrix sp. D3o]MCT7950743.1 hypothetical protein [Ancylothrix sp. D3o]